MRSLTEEVTFYIILSRRVRDGFRNTRFSRGTWYNRRARTWDVAVSSPAGECQKKN